MGEHEQVDGINVNGFATWDTIYVTVQNTPIDITIKKVDHDSTTTVVPGATFNLTYYGEEDSTYTGAGTLLKFTANRSGKYEPTTTGTSNVQTAVETGLLSFSRLKRGYYELKETQAAGGYENAPTQYTLRFTINDVGEMTITSAPGKGSGYASVTDNGADKKSLLTIQNLPNKLVITKSFKDKKNTGFTGDITTLKAKLALYKANVDTSAGTWTATGDAVQIAETTTSGTATFDKIPDGTYVIQETETPTGYIRPTGNLYQVTVTNGAILAEAAGNTKADAVGNGTAAVQTTATLTNYKNILQFTKLDQDDDALNGAVFTLTKQGEEEPMMEATASTVAGEDG